MNWLKPSLFIVFSLSFLSFCASPVLAGGGPVEFWYDPSGPLNPGEQYVLHARVYEEDSQHNLVYCKRCYIKLELKSAQPGDYLAQSSEYTDDNGEIYAKVISKVGGERVIRVPELRHANGSSYPEVGSYAILRYNNSTSTPNYQAPTLVYPQPGQVLDLEGAYMFKVNPVSGASGYLFGLFQDGIMIYENYRDDKALSSSGEFALWESHRAHGKFHAGEMKVMIRALINNQWADAREFTVTLKPRTSGYTPPALPPKAITIPVSPTSSPLKTIQNVKAPEVANTQTVVVVQDSSASAALQQKVDELQQQLEESQEKQSALENRLNQLISWIKAVFPFFK